MAAYVVSFLDRNVLSLLVEPIKRDLDLTDTEISLLQGLAFTILYVTASVPMGRIVDLRRRTRVAATGIAFWSMMTAGCGLVRSFLGLFACRVGVGLGEAALAPAAYSLLADSFPPKRRGIALAVFATGLYVGSGLALVIGGIVTGLVKDGTDIVLPIVGAVRGWQAVFLVVALPGLIMTPLILLLPEPPRRGTWAKGGTAIPLGQVVAYFRQNGRTLACLIFCHGLIATAVYAVQGWVPTLFIRVYGWSAPEIGHAYGLILVLCGSAGIIVGGLLGDWSRTRFENGRVRIQASAGALMLPFAVAFPLMPTPELALAMLAPLTFFGTFTSVTVTPALLEIMPNRMRGTATATSLAVSNVCGIGFGTTAVALFTDFVLHDEKSIWISLAVVPPVALIGSALLGAGALGSYRQSLRNEAFWTSSQRNIDHA
ncbi:MFS transporter [Rhizorhabdus dicambivorans]|nr:MFS transporter [Rhizorhabdus dicambivorans]